MTMKQCGRVRMALTPDLKAVQLNTSAPTLDEASHQRDVLIIVCQGLHGTILKHHMGLLMLHHKAARPMYTEVSKIEDSHHTKAI